MILYQTVKVTMAMISTAGTNISEILSTVFWIGARLAWALRTSSTICANSVSDPTFVALYSNVPEIFMVAPMTLSPGFLEFGMLSPVTIDSSMLDDPSVTMPSTAIFCPGLTRIISSTTTSPIGTTTVSSFRITSASLACKSSNFSIALLARPFIVSSRTCPSSMNVITKAATSKNTGWCAVMA